MRELVGEDERGLLASAGEREGAPSQAEVGRDRRAHEREPIATDPRMRRLFGR